MTVRLFAVPGLLVLGWSLRPVIRESDRLVRGRGWGVFAVILVLGLGAWMLASVPVAGTLLTSALVAPVHAAAVVAFLGAEAG